MNACQEFLEDLFLDVHGEPVRDPSAWENHLLQCPGCRQERGRLLLMIRRIQEEGRCPAPSPREATALRRSIREALDRETGASERRPRFLGVSLFPLPAFAAACLLLVAFGWFGLREWYGPTRAPDGTQMEMEERLIAQDLDLLEEMDLLEEIELIQKLVQIVDQGDATL